MNKAELVEKVSATAGLTKTQADAAINALVATLVDALKAGDKVALKGLGTFEVRERQARVGHNPITKEKIQIPASKVPAFKASTTLKKEIKG